MQGTFLKFQVDWPKTEEKDRFLVNIFSLMLVKKNYVGHPYALKINNLFSFRKFKRLPSCYQ